MLNVLLVGVKRSPDQFTRFLDSYEGVLYETMNGDAGQRIPDKFDAVIIVKGLISHDMFWRVKDRYVELGRPVISCGLSTSEIKKEFEDLLHSRGIPVIRKGTHMAPPDTALAGAFKAALQPKPELKENTMDRIQLYDLTGKFPRFTPEAQRFLSDLLNRFTNAEAARELGRLGYRKNNGTAFKAPDICNYRNAPWFKSADGRETIKAARKTSTATTSVSRNKVQELMGRVLAAKNITAARKVELLEEIHAGVRTTDQQVIAEQKEGKLQITLQSIFEPDDKPLLFIDRVTAVAITQCIKDIREFADGSIGA